MGMHMLKVYASVLNASLWKFIQLHYHFVLAGAFKYLVSARLGISVATRQQGENNRDNIRAHYY
jgi:hypothetical protein